MGDSEQYQAAATAEEDGPSSAPWVMGVLVVVGLVVVVVVAGHYSAGSGRSVPANPYISKVEVAGLHMATAENFAGGTVTYIEGRMANHGDKRITGARIEILFKDTLG